MPSLGLVWMRNGADCGLGYRRWIVHTIAGYYGLTSWSVSSTAVGVPEKDMKGGREMRYSFVGMRPWEKVLDRRPLYLQL